MKYFLIVLTVLSVFIAMCGCTKKTESVSALMVDKPVQSAQIAIAAAPPGLTALKNAYPDFIAGIAENKIIFKDGSEMIYDDGLGEKIYSVMLDTADLEEQLRQKYPLGRPSGPPAKNFEPGRTRCQQFFKKIYGSTAEEVKSHLVPVIWMPDSVGKTVFFTSLNGAAAALEKVSKELDALPENLKRYVMKTSGTFNFRTIKDTQRLSMHSFGIAIDIDASKSNYWKWDNPGSGPDDDQVYRNDIPYEIAAVFEKYGFVWGGKWYHYDTMHFEYRPELLQQE